MAEFMAALEHINALAEASPGYVWRLQTDDGNATATGPSTTNDGAGTLAR
ncbi:MAG: DUF3291 domain-containing protein [Solirubrobacterales bacterium]|nr:DUF3291 domain-containing protein [Solirubrobacterales bacterium]